jgi:hypothetical protein
LFESILNFLFKNLNKLPNKRRSSVLLGKWIANKLFKRFNKDKFDEFNFKFIYKFETIKRSRPLKNLKMFLNFVN